MNSHDHPTDVTFAWHPTNWGPKEIENPDQLKIMYSVHVLKNSWALNNSARNEKSTEHDGQLPSSTHA